MFASLIARILANAVAGGNHFEGPRTSPRWSWLWRPTAVCGRRLDILPGHL
jgi:hypothetical protein